MDLSKVQARAAAVSVRQLTPVGGASPGLDNGTQCPGPFPASAPLLPTNPMFQGSLKERTQQN